MDFFKFSHLYGNKFEVFMMIGRNYCAYLYNEQQLKIIDVGIISEIELPNDMVYPHKSINYPFLKKQIEDLFKSHLCALADKKLTLNCFCRTGYMGDVCFLRISLAGEYFQYAVFYNMKPYREDKACKITITQITRDYSKFPPCN